MKRLAQNPLSRLNKAVSIAAILVLLLVSTGDIHSHFCFDGQEPAVTLHFENLSGHPEHDEDESPHNDFESELSVNTLQVKFFDFSQVFTVNTASGTYVDIPFNQVNGSTIEKDDVQDLNNALRPPLRAPPILA